MSNKSATYKHIHVRVWSVTSYRSLPAGPVVALRLVKVDLIRQMSFALRCTAAATLLLFIHMLTAANADTYAVCTRMYSVLNVALK